MSPIGPSRHFAALRNLVAIGANRAFSGMAPKTKVDQTRTLAR